MPVLNQIVAVENGVKTSTQNRKSTIYKGVQKPALYSGITRNYQPKDEEGDHLPPESTLVQRTAASSLEDFQEAVARLFDVTATKETANTQAKADVVVDGEVILSDVPVTYLLFLEKQLVDIRTFVGELPLLDPSEEWEYDPALNVWATPTGQTTKTKKVFRNHVLAEATDKHPAQVQTYSEDVIVGYWNQRKLSGALPASRQKVLLDRVVKLQDAVKMAREAANSVDVTDVSAANSIFGYLWGDNSVSMR